MNNIAWRCIKDHYLTSTEYYLLGEIVWKKKKEKMDPTHWVRIKEWDR